MSELDKFKRRTIRSVARLVLKEKKPPEEVWTQMKKETGTDCRVLWERMRALCIKKLNRMIAVDDRSSSLPGIARLSLTDWLLVDLMLVHEDIDVIGMENADSKEPAALIELFNLVQRFDVEGRAGDSLAEGWAAATVYYNQLGRQCSPMLLQRRWYQLKKLARCRFYKFWFSYKGNYRLLPEARKAMPTRLQMAIAKRYPKVITGEFPDWEKQIQSRLIVMPEEFETKMRMPNLPKPCNSNDPDLVVVEPVIETIDLGIDSDPEDNNSDRMDDPSDPEASNDADMTDAQECTKTNKHQDVKIKTEPVEVDGLSNVQLISATHVPEVEISDDSPEENFSPEIPSDKNTDVLKAIPPKLEVSSPGTDDDDVIVIPSVPTTIALDKEPTDDIGKILSTENSTKDLNVASNVLHINDVDDVIDDLIKIKAEEFCRKATENCSDEKSVASTVDDLINEKIDSFLSTSMEGGKKPVVSTMNLTNNKVLEETAVDLMADLNFIDDGIEFVDDGVEFVEDYNPKEIESTETASPDDRNQENGDGTNNFDKKLLMCPVVYTTKLDQMKIFKMKSFCTVANKEDIAMAVIESKPDIKKELTTNIKQESVDSIDDVIMNDDISENGEDSEDDMVPIISNNSYMLRKPKTRSYDPIKLCKNPDFNTKLKRLTIGFLSSTRNRQLLNACIPVTIDLSKTFECKLVDGTLYLKSSGVIQNTVKVEVTDKQCTSMIPTAMPVQSLIDNSKMDIETLIANQISETESIVAERKKVNLPDIDKVRRLNQQLLTAQVPPIRVASVAGGRTQTSPVQVPNAVEKNSEKPGLHLGVAGPTPYPTIVSVESTSDNISPGTVKAENKNVDEPPPEIEPADTLPPAKQKLLKIINEAKISTQEALAKIDSSNIEFPKPIELNKVKTVRSVMGQEVEKKVRVSTKSSRAPVAWAPKYAQINDKLDDFLLTDDTLNKMLHLMMSGDKDVKDCNCCSTKPTKKVKSKKDSTAEKPKSVQTQKRPSKDKVLPDKPSSASAVPSKKPIAQGKVIRYCCWVNQKLNNRKRLTKHTCHPEDCKCCCRDKLAQKLLVDHEKSKEELEMRMETIRAEKSMQNAIQSIENVVQQSREISGTSVVASVTIDVDSIPSTSPGKKKVFINVSQSPKSETLTSPTKVPTVVTRVTSAPSNYAQVKQRLEARSEPIIDHIHKNAQKTPALSSQGSCKPCSCQTPALSQDSQRNIVIDASRNCALHPIPIAPKQDKVLYLHSKSIAKSPSESPIYLGKNKILLTTVKFPRKPDEKVDEKENILSPKIIPTLPLPAGVQLVLMPSGLVTYTVEPGVELGEDQLATLPAIVAAVQQQLNGTADVPAVTPIGDLQDSLAKGNLQPATDTLQSEIISVEDTEMPQKENNANDDTNQQPGEIVTTTTALSAPISLKTNEVFQDEELPSKSTDTANMQVDALESMNVDIETERPTTESSMKQQTIPPIEEPINNVTVEPETPKAIAQDGEPAASDNTLPVNEPELVPMEIREEAVVETTNELESADNTKKSNDNDAINRKSLLSDLMEMSGISAEDTTAPPVPETLPAPPSENTSTISNISLLGGDQARNLPELSPVTSFAELKYACEQNGKFFKLDFETGVIVPINVCIKRNAKSKAAPKTKEFIDLTDDGDSTETKNTTVPQQAKIVPDSYLLGNPISQYMYKGQTLNISNAVKPVKLFKALRPPNQLRPAAFLKQAAKIDALKTPLSRWPRNEKTQIHNNKRKQDLNKIGTKIDLVDSDEPMEEEYLVDSSDDDSQTTEPMLVEALDTSLYENSDSSDDEPLAKKQKRLNVDRNDDVNETNIFDELSEGPQLKPISVVSVRKDLRESRQVNESSGAEPRILNDPSTSSAKDKPDVGVTVEDDRQESDDDNDQEGLRLFSLSDDDAEEEDCILGV